ncbi:hypothetical protein PIB30_090798 [Stylosanthes scabra]|uniref:Uncharacterized protein n=1 Tax=Stylosanthes scabra TaxID=79078 RepID=A0ABU6RUU8_9FABA|nr:hypothetical protein [Stylosanthes scabra]
METGSSIGRPTTTLGRVVDMVEQLHISSGAPPTDFTLASVHQATIDILEALGEHDRTLHHQFIQPAPPS